MKWQLFELVEKMVAKVNAMDLVHIQNTCDSDTARNFPLGERRLLPLPTLISN